MAGMFVARDLQPRVDEPMIAPRNGCAVTGANSGISQEVSLGLAGEHWSPQKGERVPV
jgi:hypothetical protein